MYDDKDIRTPPLSHPTEEGMGEGALG